MRTLLRLVLPAATVLAACSGGSGSSADQRTAAEPGSVMVVLDTRAGDDTLVQFQVGAAALEDATGAVTPNVLREPDVVTFDDPTGEPSGLRLDRVPSGDYRALHLILVPGSGMALAGDGTVRPIGGPADLRIEIASGLTHSALASSWLVVGHDTAPLAGSTAAPVWAPSLSARVGGDAVGFDELSLPVVNGAGVMTSAPAVGDGRLQLDASAGCAYEDPDGQPYPDRAAFERDLDRSDELSADGMLTADGTIRCDRLRRAPRNDRVRLIGRVTSLDGMPGRFKFHIQATTRRSHRVILEIPEEIVVVIGQHARIETPSGRPLTTADIQVGRLAKLEWITRSQVPGALAEYEVCRIVLPGAAHAEMHPQWQGRVQSVDLTNETLVVVAREEHVLRVNGVAVPQLDVQVVAATEIERKPERGGPVPIRLADIVPGEDRIWLRGEVIGSQSVEARRIRVRGD